MNPSATYPATSAAPRINSIIGLDLSAQPGVEAGQVQIALSMLNDAIEKACDGQQAIEIRLDPVMLCPPEPKEEAGNVQAELPDCDIVKAIKRLQSKVDYLGARQKRLLQSVQL